MAATKEDLIRQREELEQKIKEAEEQERRAISKESIDGALDLIKRAYGFRLIDSHEIADRVGLVTGKRSADLTEVRTFTFPYFSRNAIATFDPIAKTCEISIVEKVIDGGKTSEKKELFGTFRYTQSGFDPAEKGQDILSPAWRQYQQASQQEIKEALESRFV